MKIVHCLECGRNLRHHARGLCKRCYMREWAGHNRDRVRAGNRRSYRKHREKRLAYQRWYRQRYPEKLRERKRKEYLAHREAYLRRAREYRRTHAEEKRARDREYARRRRDLRRRIAREYARRRRAAIMGNPMEPVDEQAIFERDGFRCVYCGATSQLELDHVVPLSRGGAHCADNLVVACRSCNASKGNKPLIVWLLDRVTQSP